MNRLIIIGNGFDLAHGLKTSYGDFMLDYLKNSFQKIEASHNISTFSTPIVANKNNSRFSYKDDLFEITITKFKEHVFNIGLSRADTVIQTYLDEQCKIIINEGFVENSRNQDFRKVISGVSDFTSELYNYYSSKKWVDIESTFFNHLRKMLNHQEVPKTINDQLKSIQEKLVDYLSHQQRTPDKSKEEFTDMKQILFPNESKGDVCFLNFNYTNTIEHYLDNNDSNVIYIHGKLDEEKNPIIFGYGDDHHEDYIKLQEAGNDELLKHQKSMLYPRTDNYARMEYFLESSVDVGFEVLILGHSCGLSDRTLLRTIFEHDNCKKIHIAFYKDVNDFDSKVIAISRHFTDKTKMRSRITPFNEELRIPQFKEYEA